MMHTDSFHFAQTASGDLTCRCRLSDREIALHSKYQPVMEAKRFIQSQLSNMDAGVRRIIVYGFACGHHIRALLEATDESVIIEVLEMNVVLFQTVSMYPDVQDLLGHPRLHIIATDELLSIRDFVQSWSAEEPVQLIIHDPSAQIIPAHLASFRDLLINYQVQQKSLLVNRSRLIENLHLNQQLGLPGIESLLNQWVQPNADALSQVPVLLVAAGPSLEEQLQTLRSVREHVMIVAVGRSLRLLLDEGIVPDFFMITDANEIVQTHIERLPQENVPMFFLSTVYHNVPRLYTGPKFIVYQHGMDYKDGYMPPEFVKIDTGGSVSTSIFDLLLKFGFRNICLVGLDLAFTFGRSHAQGAMRHDQLSDTQLAVAPEVPNVDRSGMVKTSRSLMSFRQWFMVKARKLRASDERIVLCNASIGGAFIEGFEHVKLEEYVQRNITSNIKLVRSPFENVVRDVSCQP